MRLKTEVELDAQQKPTAFTLQNVRYEVEEITREGVYNPEMAKISWPSYSVRVKDSQELFILHKTDHDGWHVIY